MRAVGMPFGYKLAPEIACEGTEEAGAAIRFDFHELGLDATIDIFVDDAIMIVLKEHALTASMLVENGLEKRKLHWGQAKTRATFGDGRAGSHATSARTFTTAG